VLGALILYERERGELGSARTHARELAQLVPEDPAVQALVADLGGR
jgi:hypothetical protein